MSGERREGGIRPDPARTVARLFLPGEEIPSTQSRARQIVDRVLALPEEVVLRLAAGIEAGFQLRHVDTTGILQAHAAVIDARVQDVNRISSARELLLGASFTAEYAVEGVAVCNPCAVVHPDQSGLEPGALRLAVSLRAIGEGHLSAIEFAEAVVGPGDRWAFVERERPPVTSEVGPGRWERSRLRDALADEAELTETLSAVLATLPETFDAPEVERVLAALPAAILHHQDSGRSLSHLRAMVASTYTASFDPAARLDQRVLLPVADDERRGMEDLRLVRFEHADGHVDYRGVYTAYSGDTIAPRLLVTAGFLTFEVHRLTGRAARNKGMALFPRQVGGEHLALCRTDGESIFLARSANGFDWGQPQLVHPPTAPWEVVQVGNCGAPIETERGWLVLTHGVGPFRVYSLGALLLDLDDPAVVVARSVEPILSPDGPLRDGYVPNVLYSCGAVAHGGRLWLPCGTADQDVAVFSFDLVSLLDGLEPVRAVPSRR